MQIQITIIALCVLLSSCSVQQVANVAFHDLRFENMRIPDTFYQNVSFTYISFFEVSENSTYSNVSFDYISLVNSSIQVDVFNATEKNLQILNAQIINSRYENFIFSSLSVINYLEYNLSRKNGIVCKSNLIDVNYSKNAFIDITFNELNLLNVVFHNTEFYSVSFNKTNFNQVLFEEAELENVII